METIPHGEVFLHYRDMALRDDENVALKRLSEIIMPACFEHFTQARCIFVTSGDCRLLLFKNGDYLYGKP